MAPLVFIADDDPLIRYVVEVRLGAEGYRVESAASGREALQALQTLSPSLIILDYQMPPISGLEVAQRLASDPRLASVPVMMLTASVSAGVVSMAKRLRLAAYVVKPFTPDALANRVNRLMQAPGVIPSAMAAPNDVVELDI